VCGIEEDGGAGGESLIDQIQPFRLGSCSGKDVVSTPVPDAGATVVEGITIGIGGTSV
jgi:hypothetical protein